MAVEISQEEMEAQFKLLEFYSTRRNDKTREYTRLILEELRDKDEVDIRTVLNALCPEHIPNESTFFRIIKDLSNPDLGILERREDPSIIRRGKAPVFYKLKASLPWTKTNWPTLKQDKAYLSTLIRLENYERLAIAKKIIGNVMKIDEWEVDRLIEKEYEKQHGFPISWAYREPISKIYSRHRELEPKTDTAALQTLRSEIDKIEDERKKKKNNP